jgi:O-antigen/teichoic acid export membrane protein
MAGIRRAFFLATGDRYFSIITGFLTVVIVSRLLTPNEIGLWVIGAAIVTLASSGREYGSYNFLIQKKDLARADIRAAFTVMLLLTILIAAVLCISAPWVEAAYSEASLARYLDIMAISLLLDQIGAPIVALLRRDMAYGRVAVINVANAALSAGATIGLVLLGVGYMSFAWSSLLSSAATGILAFSLKPDPWIFFPSLSRWREPLTFGGYYGTNMILYKACDSLVYLLLGRILPLDAVGLYNRAVTVSQIPERLFFGGVMSLVVPAFSSVVRDGRSVKNSYLQAIEYVTAVQWPALILLAILAHPTVEILLGRQWFATVPIVQILAIALLFSFTAQLDYAVLISIGALQANLRRALIVVPTAALVLIPAAFLGLKAMALSQLIVVPLETYVSFWFLRRHVPIGWDEVGAALRKSAIVAACSAIFPVVVTLLELTFDLSIGIALAAAVLSLVGWAGGLWLTQHPLLDEIIHAANRLLNLRMTQGILRECGRAGDSGGTERAGRNRSGTVAKGV